MAKKKTNAEVLGLSDLDGLSLSDLDGYWAKKIKTVVAATNANQQPFSLTSNQEPFYEQRSTTIKELLFLLPLRDAAVFTTDN